MVDNEIAGVINLNEIVRGCFQSAYLGFYGVSRRGDDARLAASH